MHAVWSLLYNILVVPFLWILFHLGAALKPKVRLGIRGRRGLFETLEGQVRSLSSPRRIWFHCSSLGEFEQAKPIIAAIRERYPSINIIVSFFSPSGYEHSKNYQFADVITYLPFDSRTKAKRFVQLVKPTAAIFIRYDVWPNHLWALEEQGIPAFIANATMRPRSSRRFPAIKSFYRHLFNGLDSILAVSHSDAEGYRSLGVKRPKVEVIGDTRYDQVWKRSQAVRSKHLLPTSVVQGKRIFVVGSTWEGDEQIILPVFFKLLSHVPNLLLVIVPHEPNEENLDRIENEFNRLCPQGKGLYIRFSDLNEYRNEKVVIVDSVGILLSLYAYASVAYVGGGFLGKAGNGGVHNVLEPAVFGIPVLFGPNHQNSQEAVALIAHGGGFTVRDEVDLHRQMNTLLSDESVREKVGAKACQYVMENLGATERFLKHLEPRLK